MRKKVNGKPTAAHFRGLRTERDTLCVTTLPGAYPQGRSVVLTVGLGLAIVWGLWWLVHAGLIRCFDHRMWGVGTPVVVASIWSLRFEHVTWIDFKRGLLIRQDLLRPFGKHRCYRFGSHVTFAHITRISELVMAERDGDWQINTLDGSDVVKTARREVAEALLARLNTQLTDGRDPRFFSW